MGVSAQVAEQAVATPEALAARDGARQLTYRELDLATGRLAARLHAEGVRPSDLVAVVLPRSVDLVVAQVAILRTGATIVPLDPANPPARLDRMLATAQPRVVIAGSDLDWPRLLAPDDGAAAWSAPVHPDHLAYVTYTSGSTGIPKGVMSTHKSLATTVGWSRRLLALTPDDRVAMTASPGFDVSVLDTFAALTSGASVHAPDGELLTSPADLRRWLLDEQITVSFLPTPVGETVLGMDWPADCALRLLHIGGAVLHRHPARGLPFDVLNLYGLTEVGVWSTYGLVEPGGDGLPSIGRPVEGAEVFVLDEQLKPTPVGVLGEIYLGGIGIARGYLGNPAMTADRFVPHPWEAGARLYRTGDLARRRPDGALDYAGRTDHQVQGSGGVRIELGEIEVALASHPGVTQAISGVHEGRLVGYVAAQGLTADALRAYLAERLPPYLIPDDFVVLDHFPLTATGKIDRQALPAPGDRATEVPYEPPSTALERQLVRIWRDVLGVDRVGIHDSFFDIGGNSMSLVKVYGHLVRIADREVSLVELYEFPTIATFAAQLTRDAAAPDPAREKAKPDRARLARLRRNRLEEANPRD